MPRRQLTLSKPFCDFGSDKQPRSTDFFKAAESKYLDRDPDSSGGILHGRDVRELVFSFLDARSIGIAARVNKAWYSSSLSQRLWQGLYTRSHGPALHQELQAVDWKAKYLEVDSAWESLIRSRRSIVTFFGPESLALLLGSLLVVAITFGLVCQQHMAIYTYEPRRAYMQAWWIERSVEEDSDSDDLVELYRLRLSLTQPYQQSVDRFINRLDQEATARMERSIETKPMIHSGNGTVEAHIPRGHREIFPSLYPLSKDASGTLEEQLNLLRRIHASTSTIATEACTSHLFPDATPHPWKRWCGGSPAIASMKEYLGMGASIIVHQPKANLGREFIANLFGVLLFTRLMNRFLDCILAGISSDERGANESLRLRVFKNETQPTSDAAEHVAASDISTSAESMTAPAISTPAKFSEQANIGSEYSHGYLLREYVVFPYFWLAVSASSALLTVACSCRSDHAGTKPASASIPRMEFEPVAQKWAYRLLDSREVSQARTRTVLATSLALFHMLASAPLAHLAFVVPSTQVEGGEAGGPVTFVILLFLAVQLAAAVPTIVAWRAWKQAAHIRAVRFYSLFAPHLRRG